jgi:hypothetical protein
VDRVCYGQIDYLASSLNPGMARLSIMIKDLRGRIQSLEEGQTQLLGKLNSVQKKSKRTIHSVAANR